MITHSVSPTQHGNFQAEVTFQFGNRKHRVPRFCSNLPRALYEIDYLKKKILLSELQKFINHRKNVINHHGGVTTRDRLNSIEKVQLVIDMSSGPKCSLQLLARRILNLGAELMCLSPGERSRFYNQRFLVPELLSDCTTIIKEYSHEPTAN